MADHETLLRMEKDLKLQRDRAIVEQGKSCADPPPYTARPTDGEVPGTSGQQPLQDLDFTPSPLELPTPAECIAHLRLLHAFAKLRHEVGNQEGIFGIELGKADGAANGEDGSPHSRADSHQPEGVHESNPNNTAAGGQALGQDDKKYADLAERVREKRWTVFVTRAVDRFEEWWDTLPSTSDIFSGPIRTADFDETTVDGRPKAFPTQGTGFGSEIAIKLPPLDVLMVWHAYMLNPRAYLEDCMRLTRHKVWRTAFPWEAIFNAIDPNTFAYSPPDECKKSWTSLQWDYTDDGTSITRFKKYLACPKCLTNNPVPYTRPPQLSDANKQAQSMSDHEALEAYLENDTGFAGEKFQEPCAGCGIDITHDRLRVGKFIEDADALLKEHRPMPGTILDARGMPQMTAKGKKIGTHDPFYPNRIIQNLSMFKPTNLRAEFPQLSMAILKSRFESLVNNTRLSLSEIKAINSEQKNPELVAKESKIAVRKCLSHYWDNSSPFGLDLVGAVIRQSSFVLKMRNIDWLHSPAVVKTMERLIVKYHRFVRIIADNSGDVKKGREKIAVPTLDVDLAWHTHQLNPSVYYVYTVIEANKFLNHDDKIPETTLHTQFQWTATQYEKRYGQPYAECACWYCECTREPLRSSFTSKILPARKGRIWDVEKIIEKGGISKDPIHGIHVSAHNAVKGSPAGRGIGSPEQRRKELEGLDLTYGRVLKRYHKKKAADEAPKRENDAYIYGAYGYPMYYPVYVPYYADPTCDDRYAAGAGGGGGACGGCAAGSCGVGASMGSCSGGGGAACQASCGGHGGASGGCGSCGGGGGGCGGGCGGG